MGSSDLHITRNPEVDLDAYCARVGYAGPRTPTLATLRALHALHPQAIAFENLDPLLRRPVNLDVASLQEKLVRGGRGGWCFEQNSLFQHVLCALGFKVTGLGARVLWNAPETAIGARTHMLLKVEVEDTRFLADVGFGGLTLTTPLRLEPDAEQQTTHEVWRLVRSADGFKVEVKLRGEWKALYRFDLAQHFAIDYAVASHYLLTHPSSFFLNRFMAARVRSDHRLALLGNDFAVHHREGETERRRLTSVGEMRRVLTMEFGLAVPDDPRLDTTLANLLE
jgi:N-hydroxyarylamine O-acetyltransferase